MIGTRGLAIIAACLAASCGASEVAFEKSVGAEPGGKLVVELERGSVEVRTHAAREVRVEAHARGEDAGRVSFALESSGAEVEFTSEVGLGLPLFPEGLEVEASIWIPQDFGLELETSSGAVRLVGIGGDALVDTSRATVEIDGVRGDLRVNTSRSPVRIEGVTGDVQARTSRAPIEIQGAQGRVFARTSRSPVSVQFAGDPEGDLYSSRGHIEIRVPAAAGFRLDARAMRGRVELDPLLADAAVGELDSDLRVNGGGPRLRVRTSRGDIRVDAD